jgi:acetylornithine deacetylase/succinyl-diaminopimelate desuccinylase-like protein
VTEIDEYCAQNQDRFTAELAEALRIPSISGDPQYAPEVRRNAEHFRDAALTAGFTSAELLETGGHPAVYAERLADPALPTALIYGHHDVQPVDPLSEWVSPPFQPEVRDGSLYGRGAVDDKGQVWMHLKAVEAHIRTRGKLPLNLKLIVEGEEESGSLHFEQLVERERERLAADVLVVSDTAFAARGVPSLCVGLRGLASLEVSVSGPSHDLHSGAFGGTVANPAEELARMLAGLRDPATRRVTIPGFYEQVRELSAEERSALEGVPFDEATYRADAGDVPALVSEAGWSPRESRSVRPTLEVNGIWGGYMGDGPKTIIPARAGAKITCRLVPDQDPADIARKVVAALHEAAPKGVRVEITVNGEGRPVVTPMQHPAVAAASRAVASVFGREPVLIREGGSIPPVETFARLMQLPAVLAGFGLPDDCIHAPNEKFELDQYWQGIRAIARLWDELAAVGSEL